MKKYALAFGLLLSPGAFATNFDLSFTDQFSGGEVSAVLTGNELTPNRYAITGIAGSFDGNAITGIDTSNFVDNILYWNTGYFFDSIGFSFDVGGNQIVLVDFFGYKEFDQSIQPFPLSVSDINVTLEQAPTNVPEPATLALFAAGALAVRQTRKSPTTV